MSCPGRYEIENHPRYNGKNGYGICSFDIVIDFLFWKVMLSLNFGFIYALFLSKIIPILWAVGIVFIIVYVVGFFEKRKIKKCCKDYSEEEFKEYLERKFG